MESNNSDLKKGLEYTPKVGGALKLIGNESENKSICYRGMFSTDVSHLIKVEKKQSNLNGIKGPTWNLGEDFFYSPSKKYGAIRNEIFEKLKKTNPNGTKLTSLREAFEVENKRFEILDVNHKEIKLKYLGEVE